MNNFFLVIPTRDRVDCLSNLLLDLNEFSPYISQVVIVDQSEISVKDAVQNLSINFDYKVVSNDRSHSVNHSRNQALKFYNNEEWLFFLDDDLRISKVAFKKIIEYLAPNIIDVLIPGIVVENMDSEGIKYQSMLDTIAKPQNFSKSRFRLQVSSGLNIVKGHIFKTAGFYFDEKYTIWGDDWDYGMRLLNAGAIIYYQPEILVEHLQAPIGGQRDKKKTLDVDLEKEILYFYFLRKHFSNTVIKKEYYFRLLLGLKFLLVKFKISAFKNTVTAYRRSKL